MRSWAVFKKTDAQQGLFNVASQLPESARARLENSWADGFRREVLPLLMRQEENFAVLYSSTGRPNYSVGRMLGLCILQEMQNLSDQVALDAFSFDVRWQHALDALAEEAYLSRRSLVEFRRRMVEADPEMTLMRGVFEKVSLEAISKLGINTTEQRLDSTHIQSNIHTSGVLQLFDTTLRHFLRSLGSRLLAEVPAKIRDWFEGKSDGCFGLRGTEKSDQLIELAKFTRRLIVAFAAKTEVAASEPYKLLERLFDDHCEVERKENLSAPKQKGKRRKKKFIESVKMRHRKASNLQSPFDPDAGYGKKGSGYSVHVAETCRNEDKPEILTDYEVHEAGRSDVGKADGVVERIIEQGCKPETLYADAGYTTGQSILNLRSVGTELHAPTHRARMSANSMSRADFVFGEDELVVQCPQGHKPIDHRLHSSSKSGPSLHAIFDGELCRRCPMLEKCPVRALTHPGKNKSLRETRSHFRLDVHARFVARDLRIAEQQTDQFRERYRIRAGCEATMSELKRGHGLGKLRVRRLPRVLFAVAAKVIGCNVKRWLRASKTVLDPRFNVGDERFEPIAS